MQHKTNNAGFGWSVCSCVSVFRNLDKVLSLHATVPCGPGSLSSNEDNVHSQTHNWGTDHNQDASAHDM